MSAYRDPERIKARGQARSKLMSDPNSVFQSEAYRRRLSEGVARARSAGKIDTTEASAKRRKAIKKAWLDPICVDDMRRD